MRGSDGRPGAPGLSLTYDNGNSGCIQVKKCLMLIFFSAPLDLQDPQDQMEKPGLQAHPESQAMMDYQDRKEIQDNPDHPEMPDQMDNKESQDKLEPLVNLVR